MTRIKLEIASPPDRERLVVHFMIGNEQFAELSQESELPRLEVYGRQDGKPWDMGFLQLCTALAKAREKLTGLS